MYRQLGASNSSCSAKGKVFSPTRSTLVFLSSYLGLFSPSFAHRKVPCATYSLVYHSLMVRFSQEPLVLKNIAKTYLYFLKLVLFSVTSIFFMEGMMSSEILWPETGQRGKGLVCLQHCLSISHQITSWNDTNTGTLDLHRNVFEHWSQNNHYLC